MPNSQHCFNCTTMKPCKCKGLLRLFKGRPFSKFFKYLRRTAQRRRSSRRFQSVHAVFWPLVSMRSEDRERTAEHPSLTLTETETESETVLRPQPIEPTPLTSSYNKVEQSPPPSTSTYTKTESNPPTTSTYTKTESNPLPTTTSYTKNESNPPPTTSSYTKTESNPPPTTSYAKTESSPPPTTSSYTKIEPAGPLTSSQAKLEPTPPPRTSSYAKRKLTSPMLASSYNKMAAQIKKVDEKNMIEDDEVQRACRSFEKYIMEMLLEERKVRDLLDVEELMYCMDKLQSPAFAELVCTFYGELCVDLFSNGGDQPALEAGGN